MALLKSAIARQWTGLKPFKLNQRGWIFAAAAFLVSVPVFFEAPLVRQWPWMALALTGGWLWLGKMLLSHPGTRVWGDLLIGFTGSWFAGAVYWGWLRWEPLLHLPVEALPLPLALWCLWRGKLRVGSWFYLGSLFGTAVTDLYFYLVDLIPHWRQLMQVEPELAVPILQSAIARVHTPWGATWAIALAMLLLGMGIVSLRCTKLHAWGFSGALLSTILVDGLFWLAALAA